MNILEIVSARRGHFLLESGHHGELWLDLDSLFAEPRKVERFVSMLAESVARYDIDIVCGPLLGGAFLAQLIASELGITFCFTERVIPAESTGLFRAHYVLPQAFRERVRGKRVAIVDDVMSAGSALRGTIAELDSLGAHTIVAGALLVLGSTGETYFRDRNVPVEAVRREDYPLWMPDECPQCTAGVELVDIAKTQN